MLNPIDRETTQAMVHYRIEGLRADMDDVATQESGEDSHYQIKIQRAQSVRQLVGLQLIRFGAWIAGIGTQGNAHTNHA
jgi:hypothetical protein